MQQARRELGLRYVLEGSVRRNADRMRSGTANRCERVGNLAYIRRTNEGPPTVEDG